MYFMGGLGVFLTTSLMLTLFRYTILLITFTLLTIRWRTTLQVAKKCPTIWLLSALAIASVVWSIFPQVSYDSIRGQLLQTTLFGLYFASRFTLKEQLQLVAVTLGIGACLSLFYGLAIPSIGITGGGKFAGAWRGIYGGKNGLSNRMAMALLAFFVLAINKDNKQARLFAWAGIGLAIALILLSTSKSGLVTFIMLLLVLSFYRKYRWEGKKTILLLDLLILILGVITVGVIGNWDTLLTDLGRDPTLTGRTLIWQGAIAKIQERPWLGYGRGSFWATGSRYAAEVGAGVAHGYIPGYAHNGFIDLTLALGLIGLLLFTVIFATTFMKALKRAYRAEDSGEFWPLGFLVLLVMANLSESNLMNGGNIFWVLFVAISFSLNQPYRRAVNSKMGINPGSIGADQSITT